MTNSNKLNLDEFFSNVKDLTYVIIKFPDSFPNYYKGSDIDVFCYNKNKFARRILQVGNKYLKQGFEIKVTNRNESHAYIDFFLNGELEFRFDLYQSLPEYKKIHLKQHYIFSVIENAITIQRKFNGVQYSIYIPSTVDDLLLRYVEYLEWYEHRPDKIGHLDYIMKAIASDSSRISFLDKLHLYTELPEFKSDTVLKKRIFLGVRRMAFKIKKLQSIPLDRMPAVFFRTLRNKFLIAL